jgi:hypothetical protein
MVTRFWRPFLGGIFFDNELGTTDRLLTFVMRCLATGSNCLPAAGIGAVAAQLASGLPAGALRTGARVEGVESGGAGTGGGAATLRLAGGGAVAARRALVVAVEGPEAGATRCSGSGSGGAAAAQRKPRR